MLGWEYIKIIDLLFHIARRKFGPFKFWGTLYLKMPYPKHICFLDGYSFHALFPRVYYCGGCSTFKGCLVWGHFLDLAGNLSLKISPFAQGQVLSVLT